MHRLSLSLLLFVLVTQAIGVVAMQTYSSAPVDLRFRVRFPISEEPAYKRTRRGASALSVQEHRFAKNVSLDFKRENGMKRKE